MYAVPGGIRLMVVIKFINFTFAAYPSYLCVQLFLPMCRRTLHKIASLYRSAFARSNVVNTKAPKCIFFFFFFGRCISYALFYFFFTYFPSLTQSVCEL